MCTAFSLRARGHYFGRNLDLDCSYGEEVCVMPRGFGLRFREAGAMDSHFAMVGMAAVADGMPLYYDAVNEHGLCMAGLNFPGNAFYGPRIPGKDNIAPFELIPWLLGQCKTLAEAQACLARVQIADIAYSPQLPPSPLHWLLSDREGSLAVEPMAEGLRVYADPPEVLSNNPPLPEQLANLEKYRHLRVDNGGIIREPGDYCMGLGALGLPGDVSSMSRFVRLAFGRAHIVCTGEAMDPVGQVFHLLDSVAMLRGLCRTDGGSWDITDYSACIHADRGLYCYTTYTNRQITCVDMHSVPLDGRELGRFPLLREQRIHDQSAKKSCKAL